MNVAATADIDPVSRLMVVKVEAYYPGNGPGNYNLLNVALVQNNVLGTQMGSSYYPENMVGGQYRHMHILRHLLTGQWGDTIRNIAAGSFFTKEYAYVVPQQIGDLAVGSLDDLSVLVFVCQDRKEVLNVCEAIRIGDKPYVAYGNEGGEECSLDFNPYVTVVNPTDRPVSALRFEVNGQQWVRNKTLAPYTSDTVCVASYSIDGVVPTSHQYAESATIRLVSFTSDGRTVNTDSEALTIDYANVEVYTAEGPLTLSIKYDNYPQEVSFALWGLNDCQYYYQHTGEVAEMGSTVSYELSPATPGLYRLKVMDVGGDGLNGTVSVKDGAGSVLFSRSGRDLMVWDDCFFNITTIGTDGPMGNVLGIEEYASADEALSVWPNPTKGILHIAGVNGLQKAVLLDISGRVVATATGTVLDMTQLPAGLYLLRVVTNNGVTEKKVNKL